MRDVRNYQQNEEEDAGPNKRTRKRVRAEGSTESYPTNIPKYDSPKQTKVSRQLKETQLSVTQIVWPGDSSRADEPYELEPDDSNMDDDNYIEMANRNMSSPLGECNDENY